MAACTGLRALEVTNGFTAASLCAQLFAGLAADVVKVEASGGDALRGTETYETLNAAKENVTCDGPARWNELVAWSDIVIWDGVTPWPGGDPARFTAEWPRTILTVVGLPGTRADAGAELIVEAASSLMTCTGYPELPPVSAGLPYSLHVGALFAFAGTMAALREREQSGLGQTVRIALDDALVAMLGNFIPSFFLTGKLPSRIGNRHTIAAPWNLYPTADGDVVICAGTGGSAWWDRILTAIGRPDLVGDERYDSEIKRVERVDEVDEIVSGWTKTQPTAAVVGLMNDHDVPASAVNSLEQIRSDPHYSQQRAMFVELPAGDGKTALVPGLPMKVGAWAPPARLAQAPGEANRVSRPARAGRATRAQGDRAYAKPLAGIRILEFGARTSVPFGARLMAELGADVIKIEPLKGEPLRGAGQRVAGTAYLFHINNAGKRSIAINTADAEGKRLVRELVAGADVWLENLAPGSLDAMGLGYQEFKRLNPALIYCSVSGYGHLSAYGKMRALDTVVQASSGLMHVTGHAGHYPVKMGISAVDLAAAIALTGAVLAGLRQREMTGSGLHVDLAMADVAVWMSQALWADLQAGRSPGRIGNRSTKEAPHDLFAAKDGDVALVVDSDESWRALSSLVAGASLDPAWSLNERLSRVDEIGASVEAWTREHDVAEIVSACKAHGVLATPLRSLADVFNDSGLRERGLVYATDHPTAGKVWLLGNPIGLSRTPPEPAGYAPFLGEHSAEVLREELRLAEGAIEKLEADGVIRIGGPQTAAST